MCSPDPVGILPLKRQALNRAHRIGQDKKRFAYRAISKGTVKKRSYGFQQKKQ